MGFELMTKRDYTNQANMAQHKLVVEFNTLMNVIYHVSAKYGHVILPFIYRLAHAHGEVTYKQYFNYVDKPISKLKLLMNMLVLARWFEDYGIKRVSREYVEITIHKLHGNDVELTYFKVFIADFLSKMLDNDYIVKHEKKGNNINIKLIPQNEILKNFYGRSYELYVAYRD